MAQTLDAVWHAIKDGNGRVISVTAGRKVDAIADLFTGLDVADVRHEWAGYKKLGYSVVKVTFLEESPAPERVLPQLKDVDQLAIEAADFNAYVNHLHSQGLSVGQIAVLVKCGLSSLALSTAGLPLTPERTRPMNRAINRAIDETVAKLKKDADPAATEGQK